MTDALPAFADFYRAVNGRDPFPWQDRLAAAVVDGRWPREIGIQTGLGKTACIDVAVWALARQADRPAAERTAATRIWYVVNRRLLVDAAFDHGTALAHLLRGAHHGPPAVVADALRSIAGPGAGEDPLHIVRLRGGAEHGARPPSPAQPTVVFATVPMFASRWLFRGYGVSRLMRPVDAALAGTDALVLLDEAHLARNLSDLLQPVEMCDAGDPRRLLPPPRDRPQMVAMTATGGDSDRFELDADDRRHPVIHGRLAAAKPVQLVTATRRTLSKRLADSAVELLADRDRPCACVVFVNTTRTAGEVAEHLGAATTDAEVVLLTGRLRPREAAHVRARLLDRDEGVAAGHRVDRARLIVVATQTLEVGADLDFDLLVTESAGVRAIVQRLGRLNRLGERPDARGALIHPTDEPDRAVYGAEPAQVWNRLDAAAADGSVDLGPGQVADVLGEPSDAPARSGELLPAHLWEWAKTSLAPPGEAPPELFFAGIEDNGGRVTVCWRAWLPEPGERAVPVPVQDEAVDVPIGEVRAVLGRTDEHTARRLTSDGRLEAVDAARLRPGDVVMLRSDVGGYDPRLGYRADAIETVLDLSVVLRRVVPLRPEVMRHVTQSLPDGEPGASLGPLQPSANPDATIDTATREATRAAIVAVLSASEPAEGITSEEWRQLLDGLGSAPIETLADGTVVVVQRRARVGSAQIASDAFDDLSFDASSTALDQHCGAVGEIAAGIGAALGLPNTVVLALREAGRWHDVGKADVRFQRWLTPGGAPVPLAKSGRAVGIEQDRRASGWPRGGRHELLSGRLLQARISAVGSGPDDLVHHLVVSHHGHGRPIVPTVDDSLPVTVSVTVDDETMNCSGDLAVDDWTQPARFRSLCETYGYWGLALLEAVLRQADHAASGAVEVL